ncbi:MAG TPA: TerC/Alx family metal homeostasis membrane protein [Opitutaceae bacterium]|jgi:tellurite resistance protein TerC|nr:TerC/Alx family metal homeostasis membrane protein [Opitutaceae bacterium]
MPLPWWAWTAFFAFIATLLALDLGLFRRGAHDVHMGEALAWSGVWVGLALAFNALLWSWLGPEPAQQFLAAYLVELCMSADNIFVFILVFAWFQTAPAWRHRVLFWGIIGAVIMRSAFILVGVGVLHRFHGVIYLFGAFLVYTGVKMAWPKKSADEIHPEKNPAVRLFRRFFPVAANCDGPQFFTREAGRRMGTPLLLVLLVVETTDLIFALDSLPAVLAITSSAFVALTSNIFAILGLRSLYFALSGVMQLFRFLKPGLALILVFIGVKMLVARWLEISTTQSLGVIAAVLAVSVVLSVFIREPLKKN